MESYRLNKEMGATHEVGEVVLVVGDENNRGVWKKRSGEWITMFTCKRGGETKFSPGTRVTRPAAQRAAERIVMQMQEEKD
ncbi:hypothetical protein OS493_035243 [Desmophyllum pertusum]|uniref:Uncharacterized protein n=1 Tax=Desmophyllum pertusum TaxID=174260 RepID=A0A9W9ZIN3_9CNID|nr:hypothetical protein OS493_035243 [Desmophyllum pertusum]